MPESASEASVKILQRVNAVRGSTLRPIAKTNKETPANDRVFLSATRAAATATAAVKNMDGQRSFQIYDLRFTPSAFVSTDSVSSTSFTAAPCSPRNSVLQEDRLLRRGKDGAWSVADLPGLSATAVLSSFSFDRSGELL